MESKYIDGYYADSFLKELKEVLVGQEIIEVNDKNRMVLADGKLLVWDKEEGACCSYVGLTKIRASKGVITDITMEDDEEEVGYAGEYKAWITATVADGSTVKIVEAEGDSGTGYYTHGLALGVKVYDCYQ